MLPSIAASAFCDDQRERCEYWCCAAFVAFLAKILASGVVTRCDTLFLAALGLASLRPLLRLVLALVFKLLTRAFQLRPPRPGRIRRLPWFGTFRTPAGGGGAQLDTVAFVRPDDTPKAPTLFIRTPYSKRLLELLAIAIASQGFNVIVQDVRGRFGSSGEQTFGAFEDFDGVAATRWLAEQGFPWFDPRKVVLWGASYLGIVQWALLTGLQRERRKRQQTLAAGDAVSEQVLPPGCVEVVAFAPSVSSSRVFDVMYHNNVLAFDFYMRYMSLMTGMNSLAGVATLPLQQLWEEFRLRKGYTKCISMKDLHQTLNVPLKFKYNPRPDSKFWQLRDYSAAISDAPPAHVSSGWYDCLLETSLRDYEALVKAHGPGKHRLVVGPWHHLEVFVSMDAVGFLLRDALDFLMQHTGLLPMEDSARPVKLWIMGARAHDRKTGRWRSFSEWPPVNVIEEPFVLTSDGTLRPPSAKSNNDISAKEDSPSRFIYNPQQPTPSLCGNVFNFVRAGECDQQTVNCRDDVLIFDTEPLATDIIVVGRPRVRLPLRTSLPAFDMHLLLCDVHPDCQSFNVCSGFTRSTRPLKKAKSHEDMQSMRGPSLLVGDIEPTITSLELQMWGTSKRFMKGHRIRLQLSGGAYPQSARNFGDSEQQVEETPLQIQPCVFEVLHCKDLPPALWMPLLHDVESSTQRTPRRRPTLEEAAISRDDAAARSPTRSPRRRLASVV